MVGAAVRDRAGSSVVDSVVRRLVSKRRQDLVQSHRSGTRPVGVSDANGVGTSVGFGLGRLETRKRMLLAPRSVGTSDAHSVGKLFFSPPKTLLIKQRRKWRQDLSLSEPRMQTASGCWRQCMLIRRRDVGQSELGLQSGWGALVEHGVGPSVGFFWRQCGLNGVGTLVWLLLGESIVDLSGWGFYGWRKRGSLGRSLGKWRLRRINYSRMKKSAMVDGNNYASLFMARWPLELK